MVRQFRVADTDGIVGLPFALGHDHHQQQHDSLGEVRGRRNTGGRQRIERERTRERERESTERVQIARTESLWTKGRRF